MADREVGRALKLAAARQCSLGDLIREIIEQIETSETKDDPFLGMFADEPELIDQVMESTMMAREAHPLRQSNG